MNILDIIILICLVPSLIQGLRKGFISQVIGIVSLITGIWASAQFAEVLGSQLAAYITASEQTLKIAAFAIILALTFVILGLLARLLESIINMVMLGWVNKLMGAGFAIIKGILILAFLFSIVTTLNANLHLFDQEILNQSSLYPVVNGIANTIFPYIKALFTFN